MILARHLSAGIIENKNSSPVGMAEISEIACDHVFCQVIRPYGTPSYCYPILPALQCRAIFAASLRDALWNGTASSSRVVCRYAQARKASR